MPTIAQSLWLPVGRANFFTVPGDLELLHSSSHNGQHECSAKMTPDPPALQVSSMRRLLEVLPAYYGYDETGEYQNGLELGDTARPVLVTLTLTPSLDYKGVASQRRIDANGDLVRAGITKV